MMPTIFNDSFEPTVMNSGITAVIRNAQKNGDENVARFFSQVGEVLQQLIQHIEMPSREAQTSSDFSNAEAEIKAEDDTIMELMAHNPNAAYPRALVNLERARQTGNDRLIIYCAFTLARSSQEYRPYPKLREAIDAYHLASAKALSVDEREAYAMTQNNLGNAYLRLPTGDRGENLRQAIACYQNALKVRTEKDFPQDYAMTQNNLGNAYLRLPTGDRGGEPQTSHRLLSERSEGEDRKGFPARSCGYAL